MGKQIDDKFRGLGREIDRAQREQLRQQDGLSAARQRFLLADPVQRRELLTDMGRQVDQAQQTQLSGRRDLARVRARLLARPAERRGSWRLAWVGAAGLAATALVVLGLNLRDGPALTYTVDRKAGRVGQWLSVGPTVEPRIMRFSDGSTLRLEAGSGSRVVELADHGARVALAQGAMHVNVTPRRGNRWVLDVGPFVVRVVGTSFRVAWDLRSEHFSLQMEKGQVEVLGPTMGRRMMDKGESVEVWVARRRMVLRSAGGVAVVSSEAVARQAPKQGAPKTASATAGAASAVATNAKAKPSRQSPAAPASAKMTARAVRRAPPSNHRPAVVPSASSAEPQPASGRSVAQPQPSAVAVATPRAATPTTVAETPETHVDNPLNPKEKTTTSALRPWDLARKGAHADALKRAAELGWDGVMASADAGQLHAMAKSARVLGRATRAIRLLSTIRTRFPGTPEAAEAAYFLGRVSVDLLGDHFAAANWFSRHMSERPQGPLARAAHGRMVENLYRSKQMAAACAAGRSYRVAYPDGPHLRYVLRVLLGCGTDAGTRP